MRRGVGSTGAPRQSDGRAGPRLPPAPRLPRHSPGNRGGGVVLGSRARRGAADNLILGRCPRGGGGGSRGPHPAPQPRLVPTPNDCSQVEAVPACISSPRPILRLPPHSLCVSSLALRSLPHFCLCGVYLYISVSISFSACLSLAAPRSLLRPLLASCSFSLPLFVWLSLLSLPSGPLTRTPHSPVYDIPRAGKWAGLQQRGGE